MKKIKFMFVLSFLVLLSGIIFYALKDNKKEELVQISPAFLTKQGDFDQTKFEKYANQRIAEINLPDTLENRAMVFGSLDQMFREMSRKWLCKPHLYPSV